MLTKSEKETVITYNEEEDTADIFTFNKALQRKLEKLTAERPAEVKLLEDYQDGSRSFVIPKKYIKINASRKISSTRSKTRQKQGQI